MALQQELNFEGFSIEAAYWRIGSFYYSAGRVEIRLDCYASQQAFLDGFNAIASANESFTLNFQDTSMTGMLDLMRAGSYGLLKTLDKYKNSLDV
jgi:hypothetical protein